MSNFVKKRARRHNGLGPNHMPSSSSSAHQAGQPTMTVFMCFADWGQEPAAANINKYYIARTCRSDGGVDDLSDVTLVGGSRSSFQGRVLRSKLNAVAPFAACGSDTDSKQSSQGKMSSAAAMLPGCLSQIGIGVGLVTQEAWLHPQVSFLIYCMRWREPFTAQWCSTCMQS
jgi:hypothetical protein